MGDPTSIGLSLSVSGIGKPMSQLFSDMHGSGTSSESAIGEKAKVLLLMMAASGRAPLVLVERRL